MAHGPGQMDSVTTITIGGLSGAAVGFTVWMVSGTFVFLPIFLTAGLVSSIAIAEGRNRR